MVVHINKEDLIITGDYEYRCPCCEIITNITTTGKIPLDGDYIECTNCGCKSKVVHSIIMLKLEE